MDLTGRFVSWSKDANLVSLALHSSEFVTCRHGLYTQESGHALVSHVSSPFLLARVGKANLEPNTLSGISKENAAKTFPAQTRDKLTDRSLEQARLTVVIRFGKFRRSRQNQAGVVSACFARFGHRILFFSFIHSFSIYI